MHLWNLVFLSVPELLKDVVKLQRCRVDFILHLSMHKVIISCTDMDQYLKHHLINEQTCSWLVSQSPAGAKD